MALRRIDYDDSQHVNYAEGRRMRAEALARWMGRFAAHLPERRPLAVVDLGCGVGRLTPALAETFGGPVWGVEPSDRMRAVALATAALPGATYLAGEMAAIPLPDESADAVLMFLSLHHVPDRAAGAREVRRVLKPGGRLLVRSPFRERMGGNWWYRFFPRAEAIEREMFPTLTETEALFAAAGLRRVALEAVVEVYAADAAEAAAKMKLRAISTFEHMSEDDIEAGFSAMDAWLATGGDDAAPTTGMSDLLG